MIKIDKKKIEEKIENLQEMLRVLEEHNVEEIELQCNTYGITNDYISFAGYGFLPLLATDEYEDNFDEFYNDD